MEALRRLKYRPTGGFAVFLLNDCQPAVSWSVLDHHREAKAAYHALVEACRPVIVVADRLPAVLQPGDALGLDVHVVSDLRRELHDAEVTAHLAWPGGGHRWRWRGTIATDSVARVGMRPLRGARRDRASCPSTWSSTAATSWPRTATPAWSQRG